MKYQDRIKFTSSVSLQEGLIRYNNTAADVSTQPFAPRGKLKRAADQAEASSHLMLRMQVVNFCYEYGTLLHHTFSIILTTTRQVTQVSRF